MELTAPPHSNGFWRGGASCPFGAPAPQLKLFGGPEERREAAVIVGWMFAAGLLVLAPCVSAADSQPVDLSANAAAAIVLGMPLDVTVVATASVPFAFASPLCAAVQIERDGVWMVHQEADESWACGVPGGFPTAPDGSDYMLGQPYRMDFRVHVEWIVYSEGKLIIAFQ